MHACMCVCVCVCVCVCGNLSAFALLFCVKNVDVYVFVLAHASMRWHRSPLLAHNALTCAPASTHMLVQSSSTGLASSRQIIPGYFLFVPISEGATDVFELLGIRAKDTKG
jgi:hypothetical protein